MKENHSLSKNDVTNISGLEAFERRAKMSIDQTGQISYDTTKITSSETTNTYSTSLKSSGIGKKMLEKMG